jgi:hypothetical protein
MLFSQTQLEFGVGIAIGIGIEINSLTKWAIEAIVRNGYHDNNFDPDSDSDPDSDRQSDPRNLLSEQHWL